MRYGGHVNEGTWRNAEQCWALPSTGPETLHWTFWFEALANALHAPPKMRDLSVVAHACLWELL